MIDNTMPERIAPMELIAHGDGWRNVEYIRADVAQAQLDAANARIAELEAAQAWVSVDERLPEPLDDVLVSDGVTVAIGYASKHGAWNLYGWSDLTPTHWMPLPPPVTDVTP